MPSQPQPPSRDILQVPESIPPNRPLRAAGNLSFLEFIRLLEHLWNNAMGYRADGVTPTVPLRASGTALADADYPCIVYSIDLRKPHANEAKPRIREILTGDDGWSGEKALMVYAQRFENYVRFTAIDKVQQTGAHRAEELIEAFEDFLMAQTPILKKCGVSEMFYYQRRRDQEQIRDDFSVVQRSLTYLVVTEKIFHQDVWYLEQILIKAQTFLANNQPEAATPSYEGISVEINDQFAATPSYYT